MKYLRYIKQESDHRTMENSKKSHLLAICDTERHEEREIVTVHELKCILNSIDYGQFVSLYADPEESHVKHISSYMNTMNTNTRCCSIS